MYKDQTIVITGGTGSWGRELVQQLMATDAAEIRILSRNENNQVALRTRLPRDKRLNFKIGDIRDRDRLTEVCAGSDIIFHLAALKHVTVCEESASEAVKTNVYGTMNLIDAAIAARTRRVVFLSTDKAADPTGVYGYTKVLGESLVLSANSQGCKTRFSVFRSGNILGSDGSVLPMFDHQLATTGQISVTDPAMSRFFISVEDGVALLLEASEYAKGGEVFIPKMPAVRLGTLADVLLESRSISPDSIRIVGARQSEKTSEALVSNSELAQITHFNDRFYTLYGSGSPLTAEELLLLDSKDAVIDRAATRELLARAGWLDGRRTA